MKSNKNLEIEKFIQDWFWDEESYELASELGKYLFGFMQDIEENSGLKEKTIKKHKSNCWSIGILIYQYGYHDKFSPKIFFYSPYHEFEFRRKFSDSIYEIQSYNSTCKKVEKFAIKKGDLSYFEKKD